MLSCGGYTCLDFQCGLTEKCFNYLPEEDKWYDFAPLSRPRYAFELGYWPYLNDTTDTSLHPVAIGYHPETEIYVNGQWVNYFTKDDRIFSADCFVYNEADGYYYNIVFDIIQIDPTNGITRKIGTVPESMQRPGRCAMVTLDNQPGIMTRFGFWFNVSSFYGS